MSDTVEIQIGGKPYSFESHKPRRIQGVRVEVRLHWYGSGRHRLALEIGGIYVSDSGEDVQKMYDVALRTLHDRANRALRDARDARSSAARRRDAAIAQARSAHKTEVAKAKANLPKIEARCKVALAFGAKR